ncbi:MAG: hypothetical protein HN368_16575 [Spirochaetales bacterium]|nr:hypothetical protein [Spirochaetales bacterium]
MTLGICSFLLLEMVVFTSQNSRSLISSPSSGYTIRLLEGCIVGGVMYDSIMSQAGAFDFVANYLSGGLDREKFTRLVDENSRQLASAGLSEWEVNLLRRFPVNDSAALEELNRQFASGDTAEERSARQKEFEAYRELIVPRFSHLTDRFTSIFPEETRAAFELSRIMGPKNVVVAGSYYAYFAVWLIPGIQESGHMTCIDPDKEVCNLAEKNIAALGYSDRVSVVCDDAIAVLDNGDDPIDLLVVDAYGSRNYPDTRHHGKAIYGPILQAALPRLEKETVILAHNADRESGELAEFFGLLSNPKLAVFLDTTEHLAAFLR